MLDQRLRRWADVVHIIYTFLSLLGPAVFRMVQEIIINSEYVVQSGITFVNIKSNDGPSIYRCGTTITGTHSDIISLIKGNRMRSVLFPLP